MGTSVFGLCLTLILSVTKCKCCGVFPVCDECLTLKRKHWLTDWLWRCVSHMDFCEAPQSYWNVRSSSLKSVCFIITSGLSSHAVNQIWARAFNPEVINVSHVTTTCVSPLPKTAHNMQTVQDIMYTWVNFNLRCECEIVSSALNSVCRSSLIANSASFPTVFVFFRDFIQRRLMSFRSWKLNWYTMFYSLSQQMLLEMFQRKT